MELDGPTHATPTPPTSPPPRLPTGTVVTVAVLLAIPLVALGAVPLYSRESPHLAGFPFFYWFQLIWVFITPVLTYTAYVLIKKARAQR